jgi:hypothetical protein
MLSKLMKYEIKATGRIFLPLFLALLVFAVITRFTTAASTEDWGIPTIISIVAYGLIMMGIFVMTLIMMIQRFYKNLISDEGYLMHTLPVQPWKHIVNKLLVSMFWILVSVIVAFASMLIIALRKEDIAEIAQEAGPFFQNLFDHAGAGVYFLSLEVILGVLITIASGILLVYASIALGQLFNHHKLLASFGAFLALNTLSQIMVTIISLIVGGAYHYNIEFTSTNFADEMLKVQLVILLSIVVMGLISGAYFAITNHILAKRLNLE